MLQSIEGFSEEQVRKLLHRALLYLNDIIMKEDSCTYEMCDFLELFGTPDDDDYHDRVYAEVLAYTKHWK